MPFDYTSFPPTGFDRADGITPRPGTPTNPAARTATPDIYNLGMLEEIPESPEIEMGEQATFRHSFRVDRNTGIGLVIAMPRGAYVRDSAGNIYKILSTNLNYARGDTCVFAITSEAVSFNNPPDEFHVQTLELNPEIEKHPMFWPIVGNGVTVNPYNLNADGTKINNDVSSGPQIVLAMKQAANAISSAGSADILAAINNLSVPDASILALAKNKLYPRYQRNETTFYLAGFKVVWSSYFWLAPLMDGGGYIQDPVTAGGLPPYFWSTTGAIGGGNILLDKAKITNPIIYGPGLSWLRLADELSYERTWFHLTRTWIGGPLGHWDKALYPAYDSHGNPI
jgi:hypothetical protein